MNCPRIAMMVLALVTLVSATRAATLVNEWNFDGTLTDSVGSNNGVDGGTVAYSTDAMVGSKSLSLDSQATSYVSVGTSASSLDFSITGWIRLSTISPDGFQPIFASDAWAPGSIHFNVQMDGELVAALAEGGPSVMTSANAIAANQWYHIAVTYEGSSSDLLTLYINGQLATQVNNPIPTVPIVLGNGRIGRWQGDASRIFDGQIDDLRFYTGALSANEIAAMIPEPATLALMAFGGMVLFARRHGRRSY